MSKSTPNMDPRDWKANVSSNKGGTHLGPQVRALRQRHEWTQVRLAEELGISPSYLNLIEHGNRPLPAHLLLRLARIFNIDLEEFGARDDEQVVHELQEVFRDPLLVPRELAPQEIVEFASQSPGVASAVLALYEGYREAQESMRVLASRLPLGDEVPGVEPWRLPSEEVNELLQRNRNHFSELETAAEALWADADLSSDDLYGGLCRYLKRAHRIDVRIVTAEAAGKVVRRFDPDAGILALSELLEPHSVVFQIAHQVGLLTHDELLDRLTEDKRLTTAESRSLARVALANYFAGAVVMPYVRFIGAARELRYDVDLLRHRFRASFEQVCHRLTTLQKPGDEGIPFHFLRVDIAGNISKRFSASGIQFARFSGACPRWNLVNCFMTPGQIRVQLSRMTDGNEYFCIARTVTHGDRRFSAPPVMHAVCLGCRIDHARELVYADGVDLDNRDAAVPVGVTCRLCERMDCEQRAVPPLQRTLEIDENVRGTSFYASLKD